MNTPLNHFFAKTKNGAVSGRISKEGKAKVMLTELSDIYLHLPNPSGTKSISKEIKGNNYVLTHYNKQG